MILEWVGRPALITGDPRRIPSAESGPMALSCRRNQPRAMARSMARITAFGVDVIEGGQKPPIAINIDQSVNVRGSQGVQIGGSHNVQNVTLTLEKLNNYIDSEIATTKEKEQAKGLLRTAFEHPLVQKAIQWLTGAGS